MSFKSFLKAAAVSLAEFVLPGFMGALFITIGLAMGPGGIAFVLLGTGIITFGLYNSYKTYGDVYTMFEADEARSRQQNQNPGPPSQGSGPPQMQRLFVPAEHHRQARQSTLPWRDLPSYEQWKRGLTIIYSNIKLGLWKLTRSHDASTKAVEMTEIKVTDDNILQGRHKAKY